MKEKKDGSITLRVDDDLLKKIEAQANEEHRSKSEFVRHAVIVYLSKIEEVKKMTGG